MQLLLNAVSFQCVWLACVWGAGRGYGWLGPCVLLIHLFLHRYTAGAGWAAELRFAAVATLLGATADSLLQSCGLLLFASSAWGPLFAPPWMLALWFGFCTLLDHALGWLRGRRLLAIVLGGAAGALSYWTGERLGALTPLAAPLVVYSMVALLWAVAMPLLAELSPRRQRIVATIPEPENRTHVH